MSGAAKPNSNPGQAKMKCPKLKLFVFLGAYQPVISYVDKATFEGYGDTELFSKPPAY